MPVSDWLRMYCVAVSLLVCVIGTFQWRRWPTFMPENQLAWLSLVALNLALGLGSLEALHQGARGGIRNYLIAVAMSWLLCAVSYRPFIWARLHWRAWRRRRNAVKGPRITRNSRSDLQ